MQRYTIERSQITDLPHNKQNANSDEPFSASCVFGCLVFTTFLSAPAATLLIPAYVDEEEQSPPTAAAILEEDPDILVGPTHTRQNPNESG